MNKIALTLATSLILGAHPVWAHANSGRGSSNAASSQSQSQLSTRLTTEERRNLIRHCLYTSELAGNHTKELVRTATHGRLNPDEVQRHLREIRSAVDEMFDDHKRLLYSLTDAQWTAAKQRITALEQFRAAIQVQIEGIDLELQMPTPDPKVIARYGKKMGTLLQDWRRQHRKMAAAIGVNL